ncbi:Ger(x)C family spore germination protein [Metabacillus fastidiosus]|uniref:Ger(x)C family spore germination protein n=1 Tax=Metabacillus fastidiosus TaxID=1458 RepID=UPI002E200674|nr:Ger(x)C family spore germination protein [Metabacillus fastidiosus]
MNKNILLGGIVLSLFFLTACWDHKELNDIGIVSGIAVEKGERDKYRFTVEVINASELSKQGAQGNTPVISYSLEGNSIAELTKKVTKGLMRSPEYSHTRVVVIDEEIAKEGLLEFLDFFERTGEIRNDFNIFISRGVKASDVITVVDPVQKIPGIKMNTQAQNFFKEWGGDPNVRMTDFIRALTSKGRNPVAQAVTIEGNPAIGKSVENNKEVVPPANFVLDGLAVFKADKLAGVMSVEDTRNYLWTQNLKRTILTVSCEQDNRYIDIQIISSKTDKNVQYKNGRLYIDIEIDGEAKLLGTQCSQDLKLIKTMNLYEDYINKEISKMIKGTIEKVQSEYHSDIFGFGEVLRRQDYKSFKKLEDEWNEIFTEAEIKIVSDLHLRRSGIRNRSSITEYERNERE